MSSVTCYRVTSVPCPSPFRPLSHVLPRLGLPPTPPCNYQSHEVVPLIAEHASSLFALKTTIYTISIKVLTRVTPNDIMWFKENVLYLFMFIYLIFLSFLYFGVYSCLKRNRQQQMQAVPFLLRL